MGDADERLTAFFASEQPPVRDLGFEAAVVARVLRRRLAWDVIRLSLAALVGAAVLGLIWRPLHEQLVFLAQGLAPAAAILAALAALWLVGAGGEPTPVAES